MYLSYFLFALIAILGNNVSALNWKDVWSYDPVFNITSPSNVVGSIPYVQAVFGGSFVGTTFTGTLVLPYPDIKACSPLTVTSTNQSFAGKIAIIPRGTCPLATKAANAQAAGLKAVFIHDCSPGPPTFCVLGRQPFIAIGECTVTIPVAMITYEDGFPLQQYLKANPTAQVNISVPSTTALVSTDERDALKAFARAVPMKNMDRHGPNRPWDDLLVDPNFDPCLDRASAVFCKDGHVVQIVWFGDGLQGTIPPEINKLTYLESFIFGENSITGVLPDISSLTRLKILHISGNRIKALPAQFGPLNSLETLMCSENYLQSMPSDLANLPQLKYIDVSKNSLKQLSFTFGTSMKVVDVSYNEINSQLPIIPSGSKLERLSLQNNMFYHNNLVNIFDNLSNLVYLAIGANNFSGSLPKFVNTNKITFMDLSMNSFSGSVPTTWNLTNIESIILSRNQLNGDFAFDSFEKLKVLDISYNKFDCGQFPDMQYVILYTTPSSIEKLNMEGNQFACTFDAITLLSTKLFLTNIYLARNQITSIPVNLFNPTTAYKIVDLSYNMITSIYPPNVFPYTWEMLDLSGNPDMVNTNDDAAIPTYLKPSPNFIKSDFNEHHICPIFTGKSINAKVYLPPKFYNFTYCKCDSGYYGIPPNCLTIPSFVKITDSTSLGSTSFTDNSYGQQRFTPGLSTSWIVGDVSSTIKAIYINIQIEKTSFNAFDDILEIYEGDQSLSGTRLLSFRGTDSTPVNNLDLPNIPAYTYVSLSNVAAISFRSKAQSGKHFTANVTTSTVCPADYIPDKDTGKCYKLFKLNVGIQALVYASAGLSATVQMAIVALVINKRNTLVIRTSSVPFCICILVCLMLLSVSSIFYALSAEMGNWVCHIRPWSTTIAIVGALSALFVKVNRIRTIFGTKDLQVQVQKNIDLAKYVLIMLMAQCALVIGFSAGGLTNSQLVLGSKYTANQLVYQCSSFGDNSKFTVWLALQFLYIGVFLFAGSYTAWAIRKVPSAFNEAPQIASSFMSMLILMTILVPLNFIVNDNPDALVLIRGFGINLSALVLSIFLFGPKIYYILEGRENDKSLSSLGAVSTQNPISSSSSNTSSGFEYRRGSTSSPAISMTSLNSNSTNEAVLIAKSVLIATEKVVDELLQIVEKKKITSASSVHSCISELNEASTPKANTLSMDVNSEEIIKLGRKIASKVQSHTDKVASVDEVQLNLPT